MNTSLLLWGLLFSSVGLGFFIYDKKQKAVAPLFCGLGLMISVFHFQHAAARRYWDCTHGAALFRQGLGVPLMQALMGVQVGCLGPHINNGNRMVWIQ